MSLKTTKYNMADIKDRVNAAELLQQAGEDDMAKRVLIDLAKQITEGE